MTISEWRQAVKEAHPDHGADPVAFMALMKQRPSVCWCGKSFYPRRNSNGWITQHCSTHCANRHTAEMNRKPRKVEA